MKPRLLLLPLLFAAITLSPLLEAARAQSTNLVSAQQLWNDPEFVNRFMGSYGVNSTTEPKVSAEESKVLKVVLDQIKTNKTAAATTLRNSLTATNSPALEFILGNLALEQGENDAAIKYYRDAIKKFPDFLRAHRNLAVAYIQKSAFAEAAAQYIKTIELGGEDGPTYGLLAYCYLNLRKHFSAESAYRKALMFVPDNNDWKRGLVQSLMEQQQYREAVGLLEELIEKQPDEAPFWLFQANAYIGLGETKRAAANYEVVRRMGKADARILNNLGDIYINQDMKDLAVEAYTESLTQDPTQDIAKPVRVAEVLVGRAVNDLAAGFIKRIQATYKDKITDEYRGRLLRLEAKIALATGDDQTAAKTLEELVLRDPLDGEAMILLANHYGRTGDLEKAEFLFERAQKLRDHEVNALVQHAQLLVSREQYSKAAKLLARAQEIRPRDHVGRYLQEVERVARLTRK